MATLSRRGFLGLIGGLVAAMRMPWPTAHATKRVTAATIHSGALVADKFCQTNTMYFVKSEGLSLLQPTDAFAGRCISRATFTFWRNRHLYRAKTTPAFDALRAMMRRAVDDLSYG